MRGTTRGNNVVVTLELTFPKDETRSDIERGLKNLEVELNNAVGHTGTTNFASKLRGSVIPAVRRIK